MKKFLWAMLLILFVSSTYAATKPVYVVDIHGAIGPATQDYVSRALTTANDNHAALVILNLNTPGGLETSTHKIIQAILTSSIPVVSYVSPARAQAANAGIVILYASHLAAMAPETYLGTATQTGMPTENSLKKKSSLSFFQQKFINKAETYIRSLAELRHRNIDWAESAMRQTPSLTANEALKEKVINVVANNIPQLLQQINGVTVDLNHIPTTLDTKNTHIENIPTNWRYQALSLITNPIAAYLLMLAGILGIFFAFQNINKAFPGLVGAIGVFLAFYAYQLLSINFIGLTLVLIGIACMITGMVITRFGITTILGIISFIGGSMFLIDMNAPGYELNELLTFIISLASASFIFIVLLFSVGMTRQPKTPKLNTLIGKTGEVLEYHADHVIVSINGQVFSAQSSSHLDAGQIVRVTKLSNLILTVEALTTANNGSNLE